MLIRVLHIPLGIVVALLGCAPMGPVGQFSGHQGVIVAAAFSGEGKRVVSIGEDSTVRVWDVSSMREVARVSTPAPPHMYTMEQIAFSPDGNAVAFAGAGSAIYLWDWTSGQSPRKLFTLHGLPSQVRFSPDGRRLVAASGGYGPAVMGKSTTTPTAQPLDVRVFDLSEQKVTSEVRVDNCAPMGIALAPDCRRFAVVCFSHEGKPVHSIPAPADAKARLSIRDMTTGTEIVGIDNAGNPLMMFSDDGNWLSAGNIVWDLRSGKAIRELPFGATAFIDGDRRIFILEEGFGVPWDLLAMTPWVRIIRVDLVSGWKSTGKRMILGKAGHSPRMPLRPPLSPDQRYFVDYDLNLWRLKR